MIRQGTLVRRKDDDKLGVAVNDPFGVCSDDEVPVVYEGDTAFIGTDESKLEDLGPENAVADLKKCGAGQGDKCCKFLVVGSDGPECQRFGSLRYTLMFNNKMTAQREPHELFPTCQFVEEEAE